MLLVGGLDAWKREFGDSEVDRGVSSSGSPAPVLNGGISSSSSSSSMRYTSPPYVRNRSGTESSITPSITSKDLGALNESPRLPPLTEPSPGPSYTLPQPSEGTNSSGSGSNPFNRHAAVNGRPPSSNRTDIVCVSLLSLLEVTAETCLGHTKLRKREYFHPIPLIPKTRRHVFSISVSPPPLFPCDPRTRVTPARIHQPVSFLKEEERISRPNARGVIHSFISAC